MNSYLFVQPGFSRWRRAVQQFNSSLWLLERLEYPQPVTQGRQASAAKGFNEKRIVRTAKAADLGNPNAQNAAALKGNPGAPRLGII
jgi:hypothetical protein